METHDTAIDVIYKAFSKRLKQFIRKRVADDAAVDDILQEVFLKIHSRIDTLRNKDKLESWIFQIARNAIADYYRNHNERIEPEEHLSVTEDTEDITKKLAPSVSEMIERLPPHYREALRLTEYEGLTQKELAAEVGISVSGAKSRVQRARAMLRDLLMQCCHFEFDRYGTIIDYHPISCCCCTPEKTSSSV